MLIQAMRRNLSTVFSPQNKWRAQVLLSTTRSLRSRARPEARTCNICGYQGLFKPFGWPLRPEASCPQCGSLERHRLVKVWLDEHQELVAGRRILHFASERALAGLFRRAASEYVTADLAPGADLQLNIEKIALPDAAFDVVVCSHVLEHVDDRAAIPEIHRVLRPGGLALVMVPIFEGWDSSYEDPTITTFAARELHFGQWDHVRCYGADFADRLRDAGFEVAHYTAGGDLTVKLSLWRGEKLFIASRR
jgi:SAM-dependent methyltransferase